LKTASAQLSKDGKKGMVLLDATDETKPLLASPKGLYADVPKVSGRLDPLVCWRDKLRW
jgi:hypothetical protein